jgi:hypothetical protein
MDTQALGLLITSASSLFGLCSVYAFVLGFKHVGAKEKGVNWSHIFWMGIGLSLAGMAVGTRLLF